jgi:hypothetical protein
LGKHRGDLLIEQILSGATVPDDIANELLDEFHGEYPVANLLTMLQSEHEHTVRVGIWIASELGASAAPLIGEITSLLQHPSRYVRFFAVDAVLSSATARHGPAIAAAISLIGDSDEAVRWKAIRLLANAGESELEASRPYLSTPELHELVRWLQSTGGGQGTEQIEDALRDGLPAKRLVAAAAAARHAETSRAPLEAAAESRDPEVSSFASEVLERLNARRSS